MEWTVRLELVLMEDGLRPEPLSERLRSWFTGQELDALPEFSMSGEYAGTFGANFTLVTDTPGQALDAAMRYLREAAEECGVAAGPLDEATIERAQVDPRWPVSERRK